MGSLATLLQQLAGAIPTPRARPRSEGRTVRCRPHDEEDPMEVIVRKSTPAWLWLLGGLVLGLLGAAFVYALSIAALNSARIGV